MFQYTIGFIGTGNMGSALVRAACKGIGPQQVVVTNHTPAKAQALAGSFAVNNREQQALAELQTAYDEAVSLQRDHARYDLLMRQNNLGLLQKALTAGQISMVEYLVDATQLYEAFDNRLSLEYEYQLRLARMYKFEL